MDRLFLDVTSSCKSPLNTGVQRVVRGIHRELSAHFEVVPLIWSPGHQSYCRLSERERGFLENPFAQAKSSAVPDRQGRGPFWVEWWRHHRKGQNKVDLKSPEFGEILLFVPEIFQDNRIGYFKTLPASAKTAAVFYDSISYKHPELGGQKRLENFEEYLEALGRFGAVFPISFESRGDLLAYWNKAGCAPAPAEVEYLPGEFRSEREFTEPDFSARKILVVSTLERRKNHSGFLEACELLWAEGMKFEVELIGRAAKEGGSEVVSRIEELQKSDRPLAWHRHVDDSEVEAAYQKCSFTVYPSFCEGFGMPILESLWHRRPCVCGSNGALGEVSLEGGCVTADQRDPGDLARAIRQMLTDENLFRQKVREASTRHYRTWREYGEALACRLRTLRPDSSRPA